MSELIVRDRDSKVDAPKRFKQIVKKLRLPIALVLLLCRIVQVYASDLSPQEWLLGSGY
jgi:hypothetical protein